MKEQPNKNISQIIDNCTGCAACFNICPSNAIEMEENKEGFLEPIIVQEKCTNCGLCKKVCPVLNLKYLNNVPDCYAYMADDKIRLKSSSGGAFFVLANEFIKNGDYVSGAIWTKDWKVKHIVSKNFEDIEKMQKSKYSQSEIGTIYKEIKTLLEGNKKVLFTGTPCQIAGLKSYLRKEYDNLFCVDIVCHGVPSPKVLKKYLNENYDIAKIRNIDFKDKTINGWGSNLKIDCENNTLACRYDKNSFYCLFSKLVINRLACSSCIFSKIPRQGDMTIGDFWGIQKKFNDELGTSLLLVNNSKGEYLLKILNNSSKLLVKKKLKEALIKNPNIKTAISHNDNRETFFNNIDKYSLIDAYNMIIHDTCDCMIINFWSAINYGAILTCFGVQCLAEKLGKNAKVINYVGYPKSVNCKDYKKSFSYNFAKKYLNLTNEVKTYDDFYKLNKNCETFIAGSDQVWRNSCSKPLLKNDLSWTIFFLDFVRSNKRKLSYSASLGTNEVSGSPTDIEKMNFYLSQFDDISVREDRGVELLKENFNINSTQVLDGIFHIPLGLLEKMAEEYSSNEEYIGVFTLPYFKTQTWYKEVLDKISDKLNLTIKEFDWDYTTPVEKWLSFIKHSKFMITDSYHGTLFSIIFNRPFIQIKNAPKVQSRFDTIFNIFNIQKKTVSKFDIEINYDELLKPLDWEFINNKIEEEKLKAENWMKQAFEKSIENKPVYPNFLENKIFEKKEQDIDNETLALLLNKNKIYCNYLRCKILANLTFGKKREHYKKKKKELKAQVKKIRELIGVIK